jgi:hypothetical protein
MTKIRRKEELMILCRNRINWFPFPRNDGGGFKAAIPRSRSESIKDPSAQTVVKVR